MLTDSDSSDLTAQDPVVDTALEGRRQRKKRATRLALKAAALDLVSERGFENVTVEDIANSVDVSVRTFFNYFSSKEDALVGTDAELIEQMRLGVLELPTELSPFEAMRTVLLARMEAIGEDIDFSGEGHQVWLQRFAVVRAQPEVFLAYARNLTMIEGVLTNALLERLGGDESLRVYAALVTTSAMSVMRVAGMAWRGEGGTESLIAIAKEAFRCLGEGFDRSHDFSDRLTNLTKTSPR